MSSLPGSLSERNSAIAFLPIKPQYAHRIVSGEKRFEFRKTKLSSKLTHLVIYASTPVKKIIGVAKVANIKESSPSATWERSKSAAGISRQLFRSYFFGKRRAYAITIDSVRALDRWLGPGEIREGFRVPQSFIYVDLPFLRRVLKKGKAR